MDIIAGQAHPPSIGRISDTAHHVILAIVSELAELKGQGILSQVGGF